jgi:hypothetical protein
VQNQIVANCCKRAQLMIYQPLNGTFTTDLGSANPNEITIILTHGWIPLRPLTGILTPAIPIFPTYGVTDWPTTMAAKLYAQYPNANIMAWDWKNAAESSLSNPGMAGSQTPQQGIALGGELQSALGVNYSKKIHFIGHSFGTLVNSYAANYLQGASFAFEPVSPTPWPAANMQLTLFDEVEIGASIDFNLNSCDIQTWINLAAGVLNVNNNLFAASSYYHPLPNSFAWADTYVSEVGLLHANAANVILSTGSPASSPNPFQWFFDLGAFHGYPMTWYSGSIVDPSQSLMGFEWSFEEGGFAQAPPLGSVYWQVPGSPPYSLTPISWSVGNNVIVQRLQGYSGGLAGAVGSIIGINNAPIVGSLLASGAVDGQAQWNSCVAGINTLNFNTTAAPQLKIHPLGASPKDKNGSNNVPAYAWMELAVPANAFSLSFNYIVQGGWQSDSLAAAFNGTNVLLIAGSEIQTNVLFGSGSIDVSAYAGQTNEFFIGIVGGTSTNAQLSVENLAFAISSPPSLQAQAPGNNFILTWPHSVASFNLQTTTNLAAANSWTTLTNLPAIVNLQNTLTNPITGNQVFYRLIRSQ